VFSNALRAYLPPLPPDLANEFAAWDAASDEARLTFERDLEDDGRRYLDHVSELAEAKGVSQVMYTGLEYANSGVQNIRAALVLWALAGQLDVPGGLCFTMDKNQFPINRDGLIANPDTGPRLGRDRFPIYIKYRDEAHAAALPEAVLNGNPYKIRSLIILGSSIVTSWPNPSVWKKTLNELDFLVTINRQLTADSAYADIVLPASTYYENVSYMTYGSTFRIRERVIDPLGEARSDFFIISELAKRVLKTGKRQNKPAPYSRWDYEDTAQIMEEIATLTPSYGGISYERLDKAGLQWPCPTQEHPGTPILHTQLFARGRGRFIPLEYKPPMELPDDEYPLLLTTGRSLYQWHTGTMSRKVKGLNRLRGEELVEINPRDASALGIADGEMVKVVSRREEIAAKAKVTEVSPVGVVFTTFHFAESPANVLTNPALDPVAKIPEFKVCAVRVEKYK